MVKCDGSYIVLYQNNKNFDLKFELHSWLWFKILDSSNHILAAESRSGLFLLLFGATDTSAPSSSSEHSSTPTSYKVCWSLLGAAWPEHALPLSPTTPDFFFLGLHFDGPTEFCVFSKAFEPAPKLSCVLHCWRRGGSPQSCSMALEACCPT